MATIDSPFVVKLFHAFQTRGHLCMVMEYLTGGELYSHLKRGGSFSEARTAFYAAEITLGLETLHRNGIIYRDLKLENVLLDEVGHIKLTDFGLAGRTLQEGNKEKKRYSFCGTMEYLAPEIIKGCGYDKAVDWWSLVSRTLDKYR